MLAFYLSPLRGERSTEANARSGEGPGTDPNKLPLTRLALRARHPLPASGAREVTAPAIISLRSMIADPPHKGEGKNPLTRE